jgi:hypothetical protein
MAFDPTTARPVEPSDYQPAPASPSAAPGSTPQVGNFDVSTARPVQQKSFWEGFGTGSGGFVGLLKAPFTESIPAEVAKVRARQFKQDPWLAAMPTDVGVAIEVVRKVTEAFHNPVDQRSFPQRMKDSYHDIVSLTKTSEGRGILAGSMTKSLAADPELFFIPGALEARAAGAVPETLYGSARAARVAATVAGRGTSAATGAALGAGTTTLSEIGDEQPVDPGQIGVSTLLGAVGGSAVPTARRGFKLRQMTSEEIDRVLTPAAEASGEVPAHTEIVPVADGYSVRMRGHKDGQVFATRAEAEEASRDLQSVASAYRTLSTVPRGTSGWSRMKAFLHENPFTPENMARWVKWDGKRVDEAGNRVLRFMKRLAAPAAIGAGLGYYLDKDDAAGAEFGAAIGAVPGLLPRDKRISIEEVINVRNGLLAVMARNTLQFKSAIEALVPEADRRAAISLALEGQEGITLNPREQQVADQVREFYDAMGRTAVDAGVLKELVANYVTHIVEEDPDAPFTTGGKQTLVQKIVDVLTGQRSRPVQPGGAQFTQPRQYATFGELMGALKGSNLRVKTGDIAEIIATYSTSMFKTITDRRMLDALKQVPVAGMPPFVIPKDDVPKYARTPGKEVDITLEGEVSGSRPVPEALPPGRQITPSDHPPAARTEGIGFQLPPEPAPGISAQKFAARDRMLLQPQDKSDSTYVINPSRQLMGFAVHKDIAPQLNFVFHARDPMDVTLGMMALNQASKRAIVSFSMFHAKSLYDAFVGAMGTKAGSPLGALEKAKRAVAAYKFGDPARDRDIDALLRQGLVLQPPEDMRPTQAQAALTKISKAIDQHLPVNGVTAKGARAIAAFNEKLDHFTFGSLQTGFKLIVGLDALERLTAKGMPQDAAARMAASYANDLFGSLDWFRIANDTGSRLGRDVAYQFFAPTGRRWMQLGIFAPDWTISTFRAAYKALPGAVEDPALAALHRRYLLKSALYYLTVAGAINLVTAGKPIYENDNPTRIQLSDGRTMQFSKHFMEPFEWLRDPFQTVANKLAFLPREAVQQLTGKEYISVHDAAPDIDNRAQHLADQFLPIPGQQYLGGGGVESVLGLVGMPVYGKTEEQKRLARVQKKERAALKKKQAAEYYQRVGR